jgi:hypothetical protein
MSRLDLSKPFHWFFLLLCAMAVLLAIPCLIFFFYGGWFGLLFMGWVLCEVWESVDSDDSDEPRYRRMSKIESLPSELKKTTPPPKDPKPDPLW